jgi:hypothetical protein
VIVGAQQRDCRVGNHPWSTTLKRHGSQRVRCAKWRPGVGESSAMAAPLVSSLYVPLRPVRGVHSTCWRLATWRARTRGRES